MSDKNKSTKSQTFQSFKDKWEKNESLAFAQTLDENSDVFKWIVNRNGFNGSLELSDYLSDKSRILDAGCGNGRVTALLHRFAPDNAETVGIDLTAAHVAQKNLETLDKIHIYQKDLLDDLSDLGNFDFIYSQEVLHHTADPKRSFDNLVQLLNYKGEIAIYVYKVKAPLREFADDYVRDLISKMPYEESAKALEEITEFGRVLSEKGIEVEVPKVDLLGIEAGKYDLQRFIYHFFFKCYWNNMFNKDENNAINYDWYHPQIATRHTLEEVIGWFEDNDLEITHKFVDHYGITMRGRRN